MKLRGILFMLIGAGFLSACGPSIKEWKPDNQRRAYSVAVRKTAPQPVYNRLSWVHPPEPLPEPGLPAMSGPTIFQVLHLNLKNVTLEEASKVLADSVRYSSFCSSNIAKQRISINKLGTVDELAEELALASDIRVQVDHEGHAIRFLGKPSPRPEFYETQPSGKVVDNQVLQGKAEPNGN